MEPAVNLTCEAARPLVPGYLDGQLSELSASPLRAHLLACPACRESAKEGRNLKRFFAAPPAAVPVPAGFAARVARRALAGDPGLLQPEPPPALGRAARPLLPMLLVATAAAAVLLFVLALAIQRQNLPAGDGLRAQEPPPWLENEARDLPLTLDSEAAAGSPTR